MMMMIMTIMMTILFEEDLRRYLILYNYQCIIMIFLNFTDIIQNIFDSSMMMMEMMIEMLMDMEMMGRPSTSVKEQV